MSMMLPGGGFAPDPRANLSRQPMTQPPAGGFGGQPPAMGTPFNKPTGPQVQQPMGGYGPGINNFSAAPGGSFGQPQQPGMGQQSSPYDMMQRYQQMMQGLQGFGGQQGGYGMPPQPMGGGRQYGQSSYADPRPDTRPDPFKPLIQRGPDTAMGEPMGIGMPPMQQPMDRQRQLGQGHSPEMQAYYDRDRADQIERSQRMLAMQQQPNPMQSNPMSQQQDFLRPQAPMQQQMLEQQRMAQQQPIPMQQGGGMEMGQMLGGMPQQAPMQSNPMQPQVMRPPAMPQAPNSQQVAFESPRMQAMRNMQRRGGPKR